MNLYKRYFIAVIAMLMPLACLAGSPKRGLCWEEGKLNLGAGQASMLKPGVAWVYNWGPSPANPNVYSDDFCFVPMAWNANYDAQRIRSWLKNHPETRWLLGFNEPNFADQAAMTPSQAAEAWPGLEAIADEFDVSLVAPALNFSASQVGGKVWGIYEWYDEFFRLYPEARVDCLALHCYMNWCSAMNWFVTEYIYKDLYTPSNENYGKYPYLVKFLDDYKRSKGHFPRVLLTEFCGWEYDYLPDVYFQIDQMTQKIQRLEQSDLVEGYAWFMGNPGGGASSFPYMSILKTFSADSPLSELGTVYVNMSSFDRSRYYMPGETIMAKDYVDASTDNDQVKVRPNSDPVSPAPLQIEIPAKGKSEYLIEIPEDGTYMFTLHGKTDKNSAITIYIDSEKSGETTMESSRGNWMDFSLKGPFKEGRHSITICNSGNAPIIMNTLSFTDDSSGIDIVSPEKETDIEIFTLQGSSLGNQRPNDLKPGIYIIRKSDGKTAKIII